MTSSKRSSAEQAEYMFTENMAIQPHESVTIVYDEDSPMEMVNALHEVARKNGREGCSISAYSHPFVRAASCRALTISIGLSSS